MLASMRVAPDHESRGDRAGSAPDDGAGHPAPHLGLLYGGRGTSALHKMYPPSSSLSGTNMTSEEFLAKLAGAPLAYQPGTVWTTASPPTWSGLTVEAARGRKLGEVLASASEAARHGRTSFTIPAEQHNRYARWLRSIRERASPITCQPDAASNSSAAAMRRIDRRRLRALCADAPRQGNAGRGAYPVEENRPSNRTSDHIGPESTSHHEHRALFQRVRIRPRFAVRRQDGNGRSIGSAGEFTWGGAYGTSFWVDPKEQLVWS